MKRIKKTLTLIVLLVVSLYVVMFTLGNDRNVLLDSVVYGEVNGSLSMFMLLAFSAGILLSGLFASVFLVKGSHQKRKVVKELKKTTKELDKIRSVSEPA
ncbi:MAG: LapA family protein [Pseudomonadota bacterium]